jgi:N-formylglutamate deformylase
MSYELKQGRVPLLVSMPHVGTGVPPELARRMRPEALQLVDTDWRVDELYDFLGELDVSLIQARYSRYVVDLNRPPDGGSLYPGKTVSAICPLQSFAGCDLYRPGEDPGPAEVGLRIQDYWHPYHQALRAELERLKAQHGYALLWDAHSIASKVPGLFAGTLPDLNFGTADGVSCDASLLTVLERVAAGSPEFSWVSNGRFKGGAITRLYGRPDQRVHAVQLELSQATYLQQTPPFKLCEQRAEAIRPLLRELLATTLGWKPAPTGAQL